MEFLAGSKVKIQQEAITRKNIAEVLAETFSENSSVKNSNPQFISYKSKSEKQRLNFKTNNLEKYNLPFTLAELKEAIQTSHNTAVGLGEIHNEFLKHLTKNSLNYLLKIFNDIWINGTFPESWKIGAIIPISKPGKDNSNYRPIALTSCNGEHGKQMTGLVSGTQTLNVAFENADQQWITWSNWKPP